MPSYNILNYRILELQLIVNTFAKKKIIKNYDLNKKLEHSARIRTRIYRICNPAPKPFSQLCVVLNLEHMTRLELVYILLIFRRICNPLHHQFCHMCILNLERIVGLEPTQDGGWKPPALPTELYPHKYFLLI